MPPPRGRKGLSTGAIVAIVVIAVLVAIGGYFLQKAILARPGTFGYTPADFYYVVPPSQDIAPPR